MAATKSLRSMLKDASRASAPLNWNENGSCKAASGKLRQDQIQIRITLHYIKQFKSTKTQRPAPQALDLLPSHLWDVPSPCPGLPACSQANELETIGSYTNCTHKPNHKWSDSHSVKNNVDTRKYLLCAYFLNNDSCGIGVVTMYLTIKSATGNSSSSE